MGTSHFKAAKRMKATHTLVITQLCVNSQHNPMAVTQVSSEQPCALGMLHLQNFISKSIFIMFFLDQDVNLPCYNIDQNLPTLGETTIIIFVIITVLAPPLKNLI